MYNRNILYFIAAAVIALLLNYAENSYAISIRPAGNELRTKIFYTKADVEGIGAVIKGRILSIGSCENAHKSELMKSAQDKTRVSVRLYDHHGIRTGNTLFVINAKNLITAKIKVMSLFKSNSFGYIMVGCGNFRVVKKGDRVAWSVSEGNSRYAYIYKSRADYFSELGKTGEAIEYYKRAIELDKGYPDAHLYLGMLYYKKDLLPFALKEYNIAYREIGRLYDNEDKYLLLKGMIRVRYRILDNYRPSKEKSLKFKSEGIRLSKEALFLYPDSRDVNFLLGLLYYKGPAASDVKAKNQFLKVIKIDPENAEAYVRLAVLYKKHKNDRKARYYAEQALEKDRSNERAQYIIKTLQ